MNKNAITVYIDNNEKCITEFSWLWKSWAMWDINEEWDLVACVHPEIEERIKTEFTYNGLIVLVQPPMRDVDEFWKDYNFVNSFSMFEHHSNLEVFARYENIFRTDCDTFLTQHFKGFSPWKDKVYFGIGMQYNTPGNPDLLVEIRDKVRFIAKELKLPYSDVAHVGASIIANTNTMAAITKLHFTVTKYLLKMGWPPGDVGQWPGWYKGVASMYAIDIAVNAYIKPLQIQQGSLDIWCGSNKITKLDMHIHAWHQDQDNFFNKVKFHAGELPKMKFGKIPLKAGEYCLLIANEDLDYLKMCVKKSS